MPKHDSDYSKPSSHIGKSASSDALKYQILQDHAVSLAVRDAWQLCFTKLPSIASWSSQSAQSQELAADQGTEVVFDRRFALALSGGVDSIVLALMLVEMDIIAPDQWFAVHVNHGLHAEAGAHERFCRTFCEQHAIPLTVCAIDWELPENQQRIKREGLESAARQLRYALISKEAGPNDIIITGHHLDDQVETMFLNLFRGAGLKGLQAMRMLTTSSFGPLIWRPMLSVEKAQIYDFAHLAQLDWVVDPTNQDTAYDRNYLRENIMTSIHERWPHASHSVERSIEHLHAADQLITQYAQTWVQQHGDLMRLDAAALRVLSLNEARHFLRIWLDMERWGAPTMHQLDELLRQVHEADYARLDYEDYPSGQQRCLELSQGFLWRIPARQSVSGCIELVNWSANPKFADVNPNKPVVLDWFQGEVRVILDESILEHQASLQIVPLSKVLDKVISMRTKYRQVLYDADSKALDLSLPARSLKKHCQQANIPLWIRQDVPVLVYEQKPIWFGELGWMLECQSHDAGDMSSAEMIGRLAQGMNLSWYWLGCSAKMNSRQ